MKNLRSLAVLLLAVVLNVVPAAGQFPTDSAVREILRDRVTSSRSTGLVVGLVDNGKHRVIAFGDEAPGRPLDGNSVFEIGSITKVFTATILADMVLRGEVKLEDPVSKFLPSTVKMPTWNGKEVTLLDLSTQTSGLPRMPNNMHPADVNNPYADYTVEQMYEFLSTYALMRDVGASFEYSNLGVGLLGHALARRAGKSYEQLVKDRILIPLRMNHTAITLTPEMKQRLAPGHDASGEVVANWDLPTFAGAGALRSTVNDMMLFLDAYLSDTGPIAKAAAMARERRRPTGSPGMDIGLNWLIRSGDNRIIAWHNGGTGGYRTFTGFDRASGRGVVVLSNSATSPDDIGLHLLNPASKLATVPTRTEVSVPEAALEKLVGVYEITPAFSITVTREGDKLFGQPTNQARLRLWASSETYFFIKEVDAQVRFDIDSAGRVTQLVLIQRGQSQPGKKIK